jgi:hypothetical protein
MPRSAVGFAILSLLLGCTSVEVSKVNPEDYSSDPVLVASRDAGSKPINGLHFWLPQPYLLVTPTADGSETFQWLYLQDYDREYVVNFSSKFASLNLDVQTQNGILKSVGVKADSSALASKTVADAVNVAAAKKQAEISEQQTSAQNQLAVAQAQAALAATQASLAASEPPSVTAARVALAQAQAKANAAAWPTGASTPSAAGANGPNPSAANAGGGSGTSGGSGGNPPTAAPAASNAASGPSGPASDAAADHKAVEDPQNAMTPALAGTMYVSGPVLFKVVQTQKGVSLLPVRVNEADPQPQFLTNVVPHPPDAAPSAAEVSLPVATASPTRLVLHANVSVFVDTKQSLAVRTGVKAEDLQPLPSPLKIQPIQLSDNGKTLIIDWSPPLGPGSYGISVQVSTIAGQPGQGKTVMFRIPTP